ncbi:hypothetical protein CLOM_g242 [Closterium sp. NIES-68]|nr:hypothetical protein CLOM_g242 [Closterium sp. NIES-68]GJP86345.1 hypothetical protein CLOP_g16377 [Closterium sp. NIES-67]
MLINQDLPDFPNPFDNAGDYSLGFEVKTLKEQLLCHVMGSIREKTDWMRKVMDDVIVARWKEELTNPVRPAKSYFVQEERDVSLEDPGSVVTFLRDNGKRVVKVDPDLVDYAIQELRWQAISHDPSSPVMPSAVDGVFIIPSASFPPDVLQPFLEGMHRLESVPEDQIDYHPGSSKQVVDLVHPSLHCLVYGRTRVITEPDYTTLDVLPWDRLVSELGSVPEAGQLAGSGGEQGEGSQTRRRRRRVEDEFLSDRFQWLPAEIDVSADGQSAKFRSYINNLHPLEFTETYQSLEKIFATAFVPLFNRVLTESANPRPLRITADPYSWYDGWRGDREYDLDDDEDNEAWTEDREPVQPEVPDFSPPPETPPERVVKLQGRRLQVIVKAASICLTLDQPKYPGGTWHVEGMRNESIVATGIYYYGIENISESRLQFRHTVREPDYEQDDRKGVKMVYGLVDEGPLVQPLGSVQTSTPGLCLAFPNHYHHCVAPFELADSTKPGHRKILVFFLVDPMSRVLSTARVPPQQLAWRRKELDRKGNPCGSLPSLALDLVADRLIAGREAVGLSWEEAKRYRDELMEERKALVRRANEELFERPFSLCEH